MRKLLCYMLMLLFTALLSACGDAPKSSPAGSTIKAVIKPTALTADRNVAAIELAITIPVGVVPPLLADGTADTVATVEITSSAPVAQKILGSIYTPATASALGKLSIYGIEAAGFTATDQITIHLNVATGTFPVASDFNLLSFRAFDTNGAPVTGLNPILTITIQ